MEDGQVNAAELRRQKRRQNILSGSNERIKKIMGGYSAEPLENEEVLNRAWPTTDAANTDLFSVQSTFTAAPDDSTRNTSTNENADHIGDSDIYNKCVLNEQSTYTTQSTDPLQIPDNDAKLKEKRQQDPFSTIRTLFVLFVGILVRLSFCCSFGDEYVQSMVNPFVAVEVIIIGYQKATDMDMGDNVKGGIWLSTLVLIGINPDIINTYKILMGVVTAAAMDFTLYFFGFMITHIIL